MNTLNVQFTGLLLLSLVTGYIETSGELPPSGLKNSRPNILFCISDNQSCPYASACRKYGIQTPAFDEVAKKGIVFTNSFVADPLYSQSRETISTKKEYLVTCRSRNSQQPYSKKIYCFLQPT